MTTTTSREEKVALMAAAEKLSADLSAEMAATGSYKQAHLMYQAQDEAQRLYSEIAAMDRAAKKSYGRCRVCRTGLTPNDVASTGRTDICHDCA